MIDGRYIRAVDLCNTSLKNSFSRIKERKLREEIVATIRTVLLLDLSAIPAKLHLHQLTNKLVTSRLDPNKKVNPWTLHVTADDKYKASFTLEAGTAYFRLVGEHDVIDKSP